LESRGCARSIQRALVRELVASGFSRVIDCGADELNSRYLSGRTDNMRVGTLARIIVACVDG
jgi:hypothetical protein